MGRKSISSLPSAAKSVSVASLNESFASRRRESSVGGAIPPSTAAVLPGGGRVSSAVARDLATVGHRPPLAAAAAAAAAVAAALVVAEVPNGLARRPGGAEEEPAANKAVVGDFRQRDEAEAHAEAEKPTGAGDIRRAAHLLSLAESFCVGLLSEEREIGFRKSK